MATWTAAPCTTASSGLMLFKEILDVEVVLWQLLNFGNPNGCLQIIDLPLRDNEGSESDRVVSLAG